MVFDNYKQVLKRIKVSIGQQRAKNEIKNAKKQNSLIKPNFWKKHEKKTEYNVKLRDYLRNDEL